MVWVFLESAHGCVHFGVVCGPAIVDVSAMHGYCVVLEDCGYGPSASSWGDGRSWEEAAVSVDGDPLLWLWGWVRREVFDRCVSGSRTRFGDSCGQFSLDGLHCHCVRVASFESSWAEDHAGVLEE